MLGRNDCLLTVRPFSNAQPKIECQFHDSELLPLKCFARRNYIDIHQDAYRMFGSFEHRHNPAGNGKEEAPIRAEDIEVPWIVDVLIRGITAAADKLLDWVVSLYLMEHS